MHDSNHYDVDTIFVGLSWELHWWWQLDCALERWRQRGDKRAPNSTTEVSSGLLLYVWINAPQQSRWCSQNLRRPFLLWGYLINYIRLDYAAQFFPYQECNYITWHSKSMDNTSLIHSFIHSDTFILIGTYLKSFQVPCSIDNTTHTHCHTCSSIPRGHVGAGTLQYRSSFLRSLLIGSLRSCDLALAHT